MKYSRRRPSMRKIHTKTKRRSHEKKYNVSVIVSTLMSFQIHLKLFHWTTESYAQHKASDQLYTDLSTNMDSFIEKMLGTHPNNRLNNVRVCVKKSSSSLPKLVAEIHRLKPYLTNMSLSQNTDLLNIRDEMLGQLNQFLYLIKLH